MWTRFARARADLVAVEAASWPLVEAFGADRFLEETSASTAVFANEHEGEVLTGRSGADAAVSLGEGFRLGAV